MTACKTRAGAEGIGAQGSAGGGRWMPPCGWLRVGVALVGLHGLDLWGRGFDMAFGRC